jgi:Ca2+-transporting ATPase
MAGRALRVLALAYRPCSPGGGPYEETDLTLAGLVGMMDPPREEAREAVRTCHAAGIRPVMITGDHPTTALAIARELDIVAGQERVVTGQELDGLTDGQLAGEVEQIAVYARVAAHHKLRVVRAWKEHGQVVAMTGDGVNDAPAVKAAAIGIAMGASGSDVTREAAAMVLLDDNFASIVSAVEEGRTIYDNIQKVVHFLLSSNTSELLLVFVAVLLGWPAPLLAVQLLWLNLITDGLPALALGMEPPERDVMRRRPRRPHEPVITWARGRGGADRFCRGLPLRPGEPSAGAHRGFLCPGIRPALLCRQLPQPALHAAAAGTVLQPAASGRARRFGAAAAQRRHSAVCPAALRGGFQSSSVAMGDDPGAGTRPRERDRNCEAGPVGAFRLRSRLQDEGI